MGKRKPPESIPEYVYVVSLLGYYKIGRTKNVSNRLRSITSALPPEPITLVMSERVYSSVRVENYLHKLFVNKRVHGGWFRLTSDDLVEIRIILDSKKTYYGCVLYDCGPARHCAEAARLRRDLPPVAQMPTDKNEFIRLPYVRHFLEL